MNNRKGNPQKVSFGTELGLSGTYLVGFIGQSSYEGVSGNASMYVVDLVPTDTRITIGEMCYESDNIVSISKWMKGVSDE